MFAIFYSLIPFTLLAIFNISLIYELTKRENNSTLTSSAQSKANKRALTLTCISFNILFIVMTLPNALVSSFLYNNIYNLGDLGNFVIIFCDCLAFTFHGLNFLLLLITNKRFKSETAKFWGIKTSTVASVTTNNLLI